jgi:toxin secretion/phage lysis holin
MYGKETHRRREKMKTIINYISSTILTTIVYYLGGLDMALKTLLILMVLDYITGICKSIVNKKINSIIGLKGIIKKVGYLILVALSFLLDGVVGDTGAIRNLVVYFFVANEGISILENWGAMGLPLPSKILEVLEQLKKENGGHKNG